MTDLNKFVLHTLRKRKDFVSMRSGKRQHSASFVLQMRERKNCLLPSLNSDSAVRIGYTVTKKIGNAVERNRIRRRMREVARLALPDGGKPAHDYVMIGKRTALNSNFETLVAELGSSLKRVHRHSTKSGFRNAK